MIQTEAAITLSDSAVRRILALRAKRGAAGETLMLRLTVSGGGCSGFQYGFSFDETAGEEDHIFTQDGASVVVDAVSLGLLNGAEIDYEESLTGSYFRVKNPNASSSCGCGSSFSIG